MVKNNEMKLYFEMKTQFATYPLFSNFNFFQLSSPLFSHFCVFPHTAL